MTTRTSSFIKSDSQYHRISKADGWGVWESAVWEMQITRKRDGELEDERRGGGEGVNGGGVSLCVCVCVCVCLRAKERAERGQRLRQKGYKQVGCVRGVRCHSLYTLKHENRGGAGPRSDHSEEEHINYVMLISH